VTTLDKIAVAVSAVSMVLSATGLVLSAVTADPDDGGAAWICAGLFLLCFVVSVFVGAAAIPFTRIF
jgi:hypothetical protein